MASAPAVAMENVASRSVAIPKLRNVADHSGTANWEAAADALLALPNSLSPDLPPHTWHDASPPPSMSIEQVTISAEHGSEAVHADKAQRHRPLVPLSRGALSSLDESITITPVMLARHHLPKIMLGQGPVPIRDILSELTQTVPGFSRIPSPKARRIVVAALEKPYGGGINCEVTFDKTGWGKWHAHIKGSPPQDSAVGSFAQGSHSPEHSERGFGLLQPDAGPRTRASGVAARHRSSGSFVASSLPEEDELSMDPDVDMDMDVLEEAADQMSLDGSSATSSSNGDTDNEDWAAEGIEALRKASLQTPGSSYLAYQGLSSKSISGKSLWPRRRSSTYSNGDRYRFMHSASTPHHMGKLSSTPEEEAAIALMSLGSV